MKAFHENDIVLEDSEIIGIAPPSSEYFGIIYLFFSGSGKVDSGQEVIIRLDNYPSDQFGIILGTVQGVASVPSDRTYLVYVKIPIDVTTTYKKHLPYKFNMEGVAEILTDNFSFLDRIMSKFV